MPDAENNYHVSLEECKNGMVKEVGMFLRKREIKGANVRLAPDRLHAGC